MHKLTKMVQTSFSVTNRMISSFKQEDGNCWHFFVLIVPQISQDLLHLNALAQGASGCDILYNPIFSPTPLEHSAGN